MSGGDRTDWTELREFRAVDLPGSFVLSWQLKGGSLLIDVDLRLEPGHALFEEPRPAQKACYRAALIEFPDCESAGDSGRTAESLPGGRIEGLTRTGEGVYELAGGFGTVVINAGRPMIRWKDL